MLQKLYLEDKEQKVPLDKYLWEERPQWKVVLYQLSDEIPSSHCHAEHERFSYFQKRMESGRNCGHFLSLLQLCSGPLLKDELGSCMLLLSQCNGNHNTHEISCNFVSQSCLYLTYSRTIKGIGNSTHVQVLLVELPDETRGRIRVSTNKIKATDNIET